MRNHGWGGSGNAILPARYRMGNLARVGLAADSELHPDVAAHQANAFDRHR